MAFEVGCDFFLDTGFEETEQQTQFGLDMNFAFRNRNRAMNAHAFEMDVIPIPSVINIKFIRQVCRKFISGCLGFFPVHLVPGMDVNLGHKELPFLVLRHSLDREGRCHQTGLCAALIRFNPGRAVLS